MKDCILDYVSEGTNVTYDQLVKRFGAPGQISFTYVNEMETGQLVEEIQISKKTVSIIAAAAVAMVLLWAVRIVISYNDHVKDANGYAVVEIIEYERIELDGGE